jgi:hypothetical protein
MNIKVQIMRRIHPTFSATYCKLYYDEKEKFEDRKPKSRRPEPEIVIDQEGRKHEYFKISKILDHRVFYRKLQLLVFYDGYTEADAEWVPYSSTDTSWDDEEDRKIAEAYLKENQVTEQLLRRPEKTMNQRKRRTEKLSIPTITKIKISASSLLKKVWSKLKDRRKCISEKLTLQPHCPVLSFKKGVRDGAERNLVPNNDYLIGAKPEQV